MTPALGIWPVRVEAEPLGARLAREFAGELFRPWEQAEFQKVMFRSSFALHSQWVLIMAAGIAARFIDGLLQDKHHDPAVVVIDEAARYAIALVGGHEGGANALAYRVANAVGAIPVVTTASEATRPLVVGIGCRKGATAEQIEAAVLHAVALWKPDTARATEPRPLDSIRELVTVDLKANEPGLVALSNTSGVPLRIIAKHQLEVRGWVTKPSEWVRQSIGVDGVCEPCALIACPRGRLVVPKTTRDGVAVAIVEDDWSRAP